MDLDLLFNASVISSAVRIATPLLLAALGCILCEKAGITNLAIEGFMLMGSFISIAYITKSDGSVLIALLAAMLGTMIYSGLFGLVVIKFQANHVVASIAMNLLSVGLTTFLLQAMLGAQGMIRPANIQKIPNMELDFLENIPFIGSVLHNQSFIVPLAIFMAIALHFLIKKTVYGMNVVSLGESEGAARSAGISVKKVQWSVILLSGLFSGLAGAYLSSVILSEFSMNMVQGRGFTAYTAVIFGNTNAILVWLVTLLFGWAEAIGVQLELAGIGVPSSILKMFPYLLAIVVLIISSVNTKRRKERKNAK